MQGCLSTQNVQRSSLDVETKDQGIKGSWTRWTLWTSQPSRKPDICFVVVACDAEAGTLDAKEASCDAPYCSDPGPVSN